MARAGNTFVVREPANSTCEPSSAGGTVGEAATTSRFCRTMPSPSGGKAATTKEDSQLIDYEAPAIVDFGSIADHTYQTPGSGTKSTDNTFETDKFGEFSHPAAS